MKNNMSNKISIIIVLAVLAIGMTSSINRVSAYVDEENIHYNAGYDAARSDCYDTHTCWGYYHSADFRAHSPDFRDGYTAIVDWYYHKDFRYCDHAVYDCSGANDYDHDAVNQNLPVTNTNNEAYSNNGNKNIDTTNTATDTNQKTTTTQNVVNTPTIICKGICSIPNIQTVTADTGTNSGNNIPREPPASDQDDGSPY